jgi:hypothetical protein
MNYKKYKADRFEHGRFGKDILPKKAHLLCLSVGSVGNLSMAMNHLYFMSGTCEQIYMDFTKKSLTGWENQNPYDDVMDQMLTDEFVSVSCWGNELMNYGEDSLIDIRNTVKPYFKFKQSLVDKIDRFCEDNHVNHNTVGVHVRMNDMNAWHGDQFGFVYYEDYTKHIDILLNDAHNIFVASDNYETLNKLIERYGDKVVYHKEVRRSEKEHQEGNHKELRDMGHKRLSGYENFVTPFDDLLSLIKCGSLIGRKYSNFTIAAVMLGNMKFNNIVNL